MKRKPIARPPGLARVPLSEAHNSLNRDPSRWASFTASKSSGPNCTTWADRSLRLPKWSETRLGRQASTIDRLASPTSAILASGHVLSAVSLGSIRRPISTTPVVGPGRVVRRVWLSRGRRVLIGSARSRQETGTDGDHVSASQTGDGPSDRRAARISFDSFHS